MRVPSTVFLCMLGLSGCGNEPTARVEKNDAGCVVVPSDCKMPDLMPPTYNCPAAEGLPGTNLVCADFSKDSLSTLTTQKGWVFPNCLPSNPANTAWEVNAKMLQINAADFTKFDGTCTFNLPTLIGNSFDSYSNFTISVLHTISLNDGTAGGVAPQLAQVYINTGLVASGTSKPLPAQQWIQTVAKSGLSLQTMFKLSAPSNSGGGFSGWKISSIAINGLK